jgi:hypothetical protein
MELEILLMKSTYLKPTLMQKDLSTLEMSQKTLLHGQCYENDFLGENSTWQGLKKM